MGGLPCPSLWKASARFNILQIDLSQLCYMASFHRLFFFVLVRFPFFVERSALYFHFHAFLFVFFSSFQASARARARTRPNKCFWSSDKKTETAQLSFKNLCIFVN